MSQFQSIYQSIYLSWSQDYIYDILAGSLNLCVCVGIIYLA